MICKAWIQSRSYDTVSLLHAVPSVMLDYSSAKNNPNDEATQTIIKAMHTQKLLIIVNHSHPCAVRSNSNVIDPPDVVHDVDLELRPFVGVEVHHVSQGPVGQTRAEHRDVVPVAPVVHGVFVVDLLPQAVDNGGWRPAHRLLLLLVRHGVQDGVKPVLEQAIVVVRD